MKDRFISVANLKIILEKLPQDFLVCTNRVGNLAVLDGQQEYRGYIDFWNEDGGTLEMFEEKDGRVC